MATGRIPSTEADKLALRLTNHWGHKFRITRDESTGASRVEFASGVIDLEPHNDYLAVRIDGDNEERLKDVLISHLERFARGAPVEPTWD